LMADVLRILNAEAAWVVHGHGGIDEVSVSGETRVIELRNGDLQERIVTPEDFGVERSSVGALRGGDGGENATVMRAMFAGERGAKRDAVVVNAAAALCVAGAAGSPREAAERAAKALDSGAASAKLAEWIAFGAHKA